MARLSGEQVSELQEAILDAFEADELRQFLLTRLGKDLSHISLGGNFTTIVFDVITQAERAGWTGDLLDAVARERPQRSDLVDLCGQLRAVVDSPEAPSAHAPESRAGWPFAILLAGIGLLAVLAVIWFARRPGSLPASPALIPVASSTITMPPASPPSTAAPTSIPTAVSPLSFPPLPEFAPTLTTTVILLRSPLCAAEQTDLEKFLEETTAEFEPPVELKPEEGPNRRPEDRENVRKAGAQQGADLVIWCTAGETGPVIHFEAITQRATPEVYEPETISMAAQPIDPVQRAALAVTSYLRRDYKEAEPVLRTAVDKSQEKDVRNWLTLLIGNAQILRRDYPMAAATLNGVVKSQPAWAFAWHNLGVAELYAAWESQDFEPALTALKKARKVDPDFNLSLMSIARVYRWVPDEGTDSYEQALEACKLASQSKDLSIRAQGEMCTTLTQLAAIYTLGKEPPSISEPALLETAASRYWAEPLVVLGFMEDASWKKNKDQTSRDRAQDYFSRYLLAAYDDIHLEEGRLLYQDAVAQITDPDR